MKRGPSRRRSPGPAEVVPAAMTASGKLFTGVARIFEAGGPEASPAEHISREEKDAYNRIMDEVDRLPEAQAARVLLMVCLMFGVRCWEREEKENGK